MHFQGTSPILNNLAIIDFETTGLLPAPGKEDFPAIVEVSVVLLTNNKVTGQWSSLVNPETSIPKFISNINGITNKMVADAPTFDQIANKLNDLTQDRVVVAYRLEFDAQVWELNCKKYGLTPPPRHGLCAKALTARGISDLKNVEPGGRLEDRIDQMGVTPKPIGTDANRPPAPHTAAWDTASTAALLVKIFDEWGQQGVSISQILEWHHEYTAVDLSKTSKKFSQADVRFWRNPVHYMEVASSNQAKNNGAQSSNSPTIF